MLKRRWYPNIRTVEIEITTECNLMCLNCNRSCRQAPSKERMTLQQVKKFVKESLELNWEWEKIKLLGGEPTLHPNFIEILETVKNYKNYNKNSVITVVSNGYGDKVKRELLKIPDWVLLKNTKKKGVISPFFSYNVAPVDLEEYKNLDFTLGCRTVQECGLGLTRYGYFPCGAGASLARVFGFDIGIKNLSLLTVSELKKQLGILCKFCGHFKRDFNNNKRIIEEKISISWVEAYKRYEQDKPVLSLY